MRWKPELDQPKIVDEWAIRSEYWNSEIAKSEPKRKLRERNSTPLVLCGHGVSLRIEGGTLVVRNGFTHYPQRQEVHRLFPGDMALPPRIIMLDGSGTLSFDVLNWLSGQGIPLARVQWNGEVATVAGPAYLDHSKAEWQRETRVDPPKRLAFASDLIGRKLRASITLLETQFEPSHAREVALAKATVGMERLRSESFGHINDIFAIEGECASAYFAAWQGLPIRWTGTCRKPITNMWRAYAGRSSLATGVKPENRNASHPVNAMLNYAYAVKLAHVQIDAIASGFDPMIGIMHSGRKGSPGWALDMIEPERPIVDAIVLKLVREQSFAAADFTIRRDGVCRLSPQFARKIAQLTSLGESRKVKLPGRKEGRQKHPATILSGHF